MAKLIPTPNGWKCTVRINNKRIRVLLHRNHFQAQKKLKEMIAAGKAKRHGVTHDMSWDFFKADYLSERKVNRPRRTYEHDRRAFDLIDKVVHVNLLEDMTPELLARAQTRLKETRLKGKKVGPQAISRAVQSIKTAMGRAEKFRYVALQDWSLVEREITQGRVDFYDLEKMFELFGKVPAPYYRTAAWLMGRAGLRTGEALYLEWKDVQFDDNRILFRSKPEIPWRIKGDKKLDKVRMIPLYPDLKAYLQSIRKDSGFVLELPFARGQQYFSKHFGRALRATGVPTFYGSKAIPYLLRHSFASHLVQAGYIDRIIAELMGHANASMVKVYAHLRPSDLLKVVNFKEKMAQISEKSVAALWPLLNAHPPLSLPLTTLNADFGQIDLSPKINENA